MIKEAIFFCYGDSTNASTWSNVPYLFSKTLEEKGIIVHRVDISPFSILASIYDRFIYTFEKKYTKNYCRFRNTWLVAWLTNRKIKKSIKQYPNSDVCIFTCYDYYNKFSSIKTLLLGDWPYDVLVNEREHRTATKKERRFIKQQTEALNAADCVIALFQKCAEQIRTTYPSCKVHHLGGYVINSFFEGKLDPQSIIEIKKQSKSILFVGAIKYLQSALKLIEAVKILQKNGNDVRLNIIGMKTDEIKVALPEGTRCFGYLRKDNKEECETYYKLLLETSVIVNADPQWGGFSSIVEAMYFYTPIIVAPYEDFTQEFGKSISFGEYNKEYTPHCIASNIDMILSSEYYANYCTNAHKRVEDFTWSSFVDKLISKL